MWTDPVVYLGYIDAGSGSYLLAALAGGLATIWFFIRAKFESIFRRKSSAPATESIEGLSANSETHEGTAGEPATPSTRAE